MYKLRNTVNRTNISPINTTSIEEVWNVFGDAMPAAMNQHSNTIGQLELSSSYS